MSAAGPAPGAPLRLAVLISGRGSNMAAIALACEQQRIAARIVAVIADRPAPGLELAAAHRLPAQLIPAREFADKAAFEHALMAAIDASGAGLVILAGFMRILSPTFTSRYAGRLLNIHPSLLPAYKGLHTHERVLAAGEREHGATVHFVTAELDGGPLIAQVRVPVAAGDTPATLSARVQAGEHMLFPAVIGWLASGELQLRDQIPWLRGAPLRQPVQMEVSRT